MALLKPWTRALYFAVLFVHSNYSLQERKCLFLSGSIRTQSNLDPSCVSEPSKWKIQNLSSTSIWLVVSPTLVTKFTMLQSISLAHENQRILDCVSDS